MNALHGDLTGLQSVLVCYSGGVDSAYLLAEAVAVLGPRAVAYTSVSASLADDEREAAAALARRLGARHLQVPTRELEDASYAANPVDRCYHCKREVYQVALEVAETEGVAHVIDGLNRDDRSDLRPGRRAAEERGIRSPLDSNGFRKQDVRDAARRIDLEVWDKPAQACLASRMPYGTPVTADRLRQVAACERHIRRLGFAQCRVRHHGSLARIEVLPHDIPRLTRAEVRAELEQLCRSEGFSYVTVDLRGYRTGSLNEAVTAHRLQVV
jgi:uncharacterized protein